MQLLKARCWPNCPGASGKLRRAMVHTLRQEGESIPWIAGVFGVTHQRVSNLLRQRKDAVTDDD